MYGGKMPDVRNVLFVNGNRDPWHALSVLEDLNDSSPSILIDGKHKTFLFSGIKNYITIQILFDVFPHFSQVLHIVRIGMTMTFQIAKI